MQQRVAAWTARNLWTFVPKVNVQVTKFPRIRLSFLRLCAQQMREQTAGLAARIYLHGMDALTDCSRLQQTAPFQRRFAGPMH